MAHEFALQSNFGVDLEVNGTRMGGFTSVTGGTKSITVVEYTLNGYGTSSGLFIPATTNYEPITLTHGVTTEKAYWDWWEKLGSRKVEDNVYNASIVVNENGNAQVAQWDLTDAWISRISGLRFDSRVTAENSGTIYIASVTLVAENIERVA